MDSNRPRNRIQLPTFGAELFTYLKDINDHESFKASRRIKDLLSANVKQEILSWFSLPSLPELDQTLLRKITNSLLSPGQTGEKRTKDALGEIRFNATNMTKNLTLAEATLYLREWSRDFRSAKSGLDHHYKCVNSFLRIQKTTNDENVRSLLKFEVQTYDDYKEWSIALIEYWNQKNIVKSNMRNSYEKAFQEFVTSFDESLQNAGFGNALDKIWHEYLAPETLTNSTAAQKYDDLSQNTMANNTSLKPFEIDLQIESGKINYAIKCNHLSDFQASELRFKLSLALSKSSDYEEHNFTVSFTSSKPPIILIKADVKADESTVSSMVRFLESVLEKSKYPG